MSAQVVQIIVTDIARAGEGVDGDPSRVVYQMFTLDGHLIASWDTWTREGQVTSELASLTVEGRS